MPKHSMRRGYHKIPAFKSAIAGSLLILFAGVSVAFVNTSEPQPQAAKEVLSHQAVLDVNDEQAPARAEPTPSPVAHTSPSQQEEPKPQADQSKPARQEAPAPAAPAAAPAPPAEPPPAPPPPPAPAGIDVYRGLGAWVDIYDYAIRDTMDVPAAVQVMADRGVNTLFLQTSRWKDPAAIVNVDLVNRFLDEAARHGIQVVGWYVPGFGNLDRDISRTLAILEHKSPAGNGFDGMAPDIETREEVGGSRDRYNAGVAEYSRRLRAAAPGATIAAVIDDAKNNLRAPERHAGYPWNEIAANYDVVMPMAYWTVTKGTSGCRAKEYDAEAYIREVARLTIEHMGVEKPLHPVGGIADCMTEAETHGYVRAIKDVAIGGSLYDFATTQESPVSMWAPLAGLK